MKNFTDLEEIPLPQLETLLSLSNKIKETPQHFSDVCRGKILATLFFEPSTRTQLSFQAAMQRLGGSTIGFSNAGDSSAAKGESLADTVRVVSSYADLIVIRHPRDGAAKAASIYSERGVINAGDGGHLHPTQTLTDIFTLRSETGRLSNLKIGFCGDLKYGRTVHSLIQTLIRFPGNSFDLVSSPQLQLPPYIKEQILQSGCAFNEYSALADCISGLDALYMTRIQKERLNGEDGNSQNILTTKMMEHAAKHMIILHPLPRVDEIAPDVDADPRAKYFTQAANGMYCRMALIMTMLEHTGQQPIANKYGSALDCMNPQCITKTEGYLPALPSVSGKCPYCEGELSCDI